MRKSAMYLSARKSIYFKFSPLKNYRDRRFLCFLICQGVGTNGYSEGREWNYPFSHLAPLSLILSINSQGCRQYKFKLHFLRFQTRSLFTYFNSHASPIWKWAGKELVVISEGNKIPGVTGALAFLAGTLPVIDTIHAHAHALLPPPTARLFRWHRACSEEPSRVWLQRSFWASARKTEMTQTFDNKPLLWYNSTHVIRNK